MNAHMYDPPPENWPAFIDWKALPVRTMAFQTYLRRIIDDVDKEWSKPSLSKRSVRRLKESPDRLMRHPRTESFFWKAVTNEIIAHGYKHFEGPQGQLNCLDRARPG